MVYQEYQGIWNVNILHEKSLNKSQGRRDPSTLVSWYALSFSVCSPKTIPSDDDDPREDTDAVDGGSFKECVCFRFLLYISLQERGNFN